MTTGCPKEDFLVVIYRVQTPLRFGSLLKVRGSLRYNSHLLMDIPIQIKRFAGHDDLPLPEYATAGAAGMDLRAAVTANVILDPGKIVMVSCGFSIAVPEGFEAQVRPRSGLASKFGITLPNSPGTIDSDYRGEVKVPLINLGSERFEITRGLRIAQMVVAPVSRVRWQEVAELSETARSIGGFGHTGTS